MKKILVAALSILLIFPNTSSAVENGTSALGDPNAVAVNSGWSGFLYSPRIVLTVAHVKPFFDSGQFVGTFVGYPGQPMNAGGNTVTGLKIMFAPTYTPRTGFSGGNIFSEKDDLAVIILEKSIPMTNTVKLATLEQIETWKKNKTEVKMVGYGLQNAEMRKLREDHTKPNPQINPNFIKTNFISDNEAQSILTRGLPRGGVFNDGMYFAINQTTGSNCDGDSGSGWFVEEGSTRYYLGAGSNAWGIPNCGKDGVWNPSGAISSTTASITLINLIKEAEEYIKANPEQPAIIKNVAIKTITCKNKTLKKIIKATNPVCPKGYSKV